MCVCVCARVSEREVLTNNCTQSDHTTIEKMLQAEKHCVVMEIKQLYSPAWGSGGGGATLVFPKHSKGGKAGSEQIYHCSRELRPGPCLPIQAT